MVSLTNTEKKQIADMPPEMHRYAQFINLEEFSPFVFDKECQQCRDGAEERRLWMQEGWNHLEESE